MSIEQKINGDVGTLILGEEIDLDIQAVISNKEEAKKYYSLAIENITANSSLTQLIQIKLDDLN